MDIVRVMSASTERASVKADDKEGPDVVIETYFLYSEIGLPGMNSAFIFTAALLLQKQSRGKTVANMKNDEAISNTHARQ